MNRVKKPVSYIYENPTTRSNNDDVKNKNNGENKAVVRGIVKQMLNRMQNRNSSDWCI